MSRIRSYELHVKVMLAAMNLFAERGIEAASMDPVAHAARVSKATINNHWPGKAALLAEVMQMVSEVTTLSDPRGDGPGQPAAWNPKAP